MLRFVAIAPLAVLLTVSGCSSKETTGVTAVADCPSASQGFTTNRKAGGIVQGVLVDGYTGKRVDVTSLSGNDGIFVLIGGEKFKAKAVPTNGDARLNGEYFICDVPYDTTFNIYAHVTGFLPFQSTINVPAVAADKVALKLGDIRVFPQGADTKDLVVHVTNNGVPVADTEVRMEPQTTANTFAKTGTFLAPSDARLVPMNMRTDAAGMVKFPAADLVVGGTYNYFVNPNPKTDLGTATGTIVVGVTNAVNGARNNYDMTIEVATAFKALKLVSCSTSEKDYVSTGAISYVFNRDVDNVSLDGLTAALTATGGAALATNIASNNASEHVSSAVAGNKLTLTPNFQANLGPDENRDRTMSITFAGVSVRASGDKTGTAVDLTTLLAGVPGCSLSTRFFKN